MAQPSNGGPDVSRRTLLVAGAATLTAACTSTGSAIAGSSSPEVMTASGALRGERLGTVHRFLGIPYAQGISGRNRFAPPQPVIPWSGVRDATRYADNSPQQSADPTSGSPVTPAFDPPAYVQPGDECLALNVWAPENADGSLPVMVWLHGGGWTSGSGSCAIYDGQNLAARGDVVVVTINHRLGASGLTDFSRVLGGAFADSANLSVRDMVAALEWVRDNIAAFGGNPDLVTIFGESGGGWKVNTLLGTLPAKGLFHRAIVQSGPLTRFATHEQADDVARQVLDALGIDAANPEKLNEISFEQLLEAEASVMGNSPMSMSTPGFPSGFWPVLEDGFLPRHVFEPDAAATSIGVPLMVGHNATEMSLFMLRDEAAYSLDPAGLEQRVAGLFEQDSELVLGTYRSDYAGEGPSQIWFRILSDYMMGTISAAILDTRSRSGDAVYGFRFEWNTPIDGGKLYSPHTIEIPFVFDNTATAAGVVMTGGGSEAALLGKTVSEAWVSFAKSGKPAAPGLPQWPTYSSDGRAAMHFDTVNTVAVYMPEAVIPLFHDKLWRAADAA